MAGAKMNKRRGRGAKAQAEAVEKTTVEGAVETASEEAATSDAVTPQEATEALVEATTESAEGAGAEVLEGTAKSEGEKSTDDKETPKKGNRKRMRGRKGKKPSDPESAPKKIIDFDGLIFMCNSKTKKDCFKYRVFGLPEGKENIVKQIKKGTKLFLFDIDKKVLHGVYKASSEGGVNLIEEAFKDSARKFPAQVRFRIQKDCMPLDESAFKVAIKENYIRKNRFKCELNAEQVGRLIKLFRPLDSRGLPEPKFSKETRRDPAPRGKPSRAPPPRNRGPPPRFSGPAPPRERVYKDAPLYPRERPYPESLPPSYALIPEVAHAEAELLRQRHLRQVQEAQALEALDRRAYLLDPVVEASLARKRYLEDVYAAEQQALVAKRPLLQDTLYRDPEYQREAPYRSYGDGLLSHTGALHYDARASQLGWP